MRHNAVSINAFQNILRSCCPHVKIRQYNSIKVYVVKCHCSSYRFEVRRCFQDRESRQHITAAHELHRSMYMGERMQHYKHRIEAMQHPSTVWSLISDATFRKYERLFFQITTTFARRNCSWKICKYI